MLDELAAELAELQEMRKDSLQALVDIWRGVRLVSKSVDVTNAQRVRLGAAFIEIDTKLAEYEMRNSRRRFKVTAGRKGA